MSGTGLDPSLYFASFLAATFAAALVAGLAGFAFGLVAAAVWLHKLNHQESATLIVVFGLIVQGYSVWKLRAALNWSRLWPFLLGAAIGVPIGVAILEWTNPAYLRKAIGAVLALYSVYGFARPIMKPIAKGEAAADATVGFLNGVLGAMTGFAGILVTIWCGLRGWSKDEQRAIFQPVGVAIFGMSAIWLGGSGSISTDTIKLFLIGLPILLAGTWVGLQLYGHLNEAGFRRTVLLLLFISGVALLL